MGLMSFQSRLVLGPSRAGCDSRGHPFRLSPRGDGFDSPTPTVVCWQRRVVARILHRRLGRGSSIGLRQQWMAIVSLLPIIHVPDRVAVRYPRADSSSAISSMPRDCLHQPSEPIIGPASQNSRRLGFKLMSSDLRAKFSEPSKNYELVDYSDIKVNPALPDSAFAWKLPGDVKKIHPQK